MLTGRRVPAAEAFAMGLLNRVVAVGEQVPAAEELAGVVRSRRPEVVATTKRQVSDAAAALVPTDGEWAGTQHLVEALRALG